MNTGNSVYLSKFDEIVKFLHDNATAGDLVITMGAGNVYQIGDMFLSGSGN